MTVEPSFALRRSAFVWEGRGALQKEFLLGRKVCTGVPITVYEPKLIVRHT